MMSLILSPQVVSQAPQHFGSSETQATCDAFFVLFFFPPARSFPFTPAYPEQYPRLQESWTVDVED